MIAMASEEINAWVQLATGPITFLIYLALLLSGQGETQLTQLAYQPLLLGAFGSAAGISILTSIITTRIASGSKKRDVRDDEIERASGYISVAPVVVGGLIVLVLALTGVHQFWIANVMYFSFIIASVFGSITKIVAYRRGLGRW